MHKILYHLSDGPFPGGNSYDKAVFYTAWHSFLNLKGNVYPEKSTQRQERCIFPWSLHQHVFHIQNSEWIESISMMLSFVPMSTLVQGFGIIYLPRSVGELKLMRSTVLRYHTQSYEKFLLWAYAQPAKRWNTLQHKTGPVCWHKNIEAMMRTLALQVNRTQTPNGHERITFNGIPLPANQEIS